MSKWLKKCPVQETGLKIKKKMLSRRLKDAVSDLSPRFRNTDAYGPGDGRKGPGSSTLCGEHNTERNTSWHPSKPWRVYHDAGLWEVKLL